ARRTAARYLIETGTFRGVTAARCAGNFHRVITIELNATLASLSRQYLRRYRNVTVIQGDAVDLLASVVADPDCTEAVVFLDGHFSGGITAKGNVPEPAILELEILSKFREKICGIVIDDFRCFGAGADVPTKSRLVACIEESFPFPQFKFCIQSD